MHIETIEPKNEEHWLELRSRDLTSTESSILYGLSPHTTLFEVWHQKKDKAVVQIEPSERMKWGTRLQDSIAAGIAEDQDWKIRRMSEYIRDPKLRMGASFDFAIGDDGLLEVKNVDSLAFRDGWIVDGNDVEAPPHIEIQIQHQLAVTRRKFAYIGALVGGNRVVLIKREPDEKIIADLKKRVASFWFSIASNQEPKPDFSRDAQFISRLYQFAEPGKLLDARTDADFESLVLEYRRLGDDEKKAKEARDAIKAQLLMKIGDAEKVIGNGFSVTANVVGPARIEYDREGYRTFRVNWKKEKKS